MAWKSVFKLVLSLITWMSVKVNNFIILIDYFRAHKIQILLLAIVIILLCLARFFINSQQIFLYRTTKGN